MESIKRKGIDISRWQGAINFRMVKESGIEFAIIKAGGSDDGYYTDRNFEKNYANAKAAGLLVGAYYIVGSGFKTAADGKADAERFRKIIHGKQFEMPIVIDLELTSPDTKTGTTAAVIEFCRYLEGLGYYVTIYSSDISGFKDRLDNAKLTAFDHWVARYGAAPKYVSDYGMWQYSSTGKVAGITGNVDLDYSYKDYPKIIKTNKLNGYK